MRDDGLVKDPESFFAERSFKLTFERPSEEDLADLYLSNRDLKPSRYRQLRRSGAVGPVLANLQSASNPSLVLRAYGTGEDETDAAERALRRWRTEQGD